MASDSEIGAEKPVLSDLTDRLTHQENVQPVKPKPRRSRSITVPDEIVACISKHHERLEGYITGFLLFRTLRASGVKIRDTLEMPGATQTKWSLRDQVRPELEEIKANLVPHEMWGTEFAEQLAEFTRAVTEALDFLNSETGTFGDFGERSPADVIKGISKPVNTICSMANTIEGLCRTKSHVEVTELGHYVKWIMNRREARPATQATGANVSAGIRQPHREEEAKPLVDVSDIPSEAVNAPTAAKRTSTNG